MVTSWSSTALSLQLAEAVTERVGDVAVAEVTGVGLAKGVAVCRSVAVTNSGVVLTGGGVEIETQELRLSVKIIMAGIKIRMV
jgi:hypothetical protein